MENICKGCTHCLKHNDDGRKLKTTDSHGLKWEWVPLTGSKCSLLDMDMVDVVKCEMFKKKN